MEKRCYFSQFHWYRYQSQKGEKIAEIKHVSFDAEAGGLFLSSSGGWLGTCGSALTDMLHNYIAGIILI